MAGIRRAQEGFTFVELMVVIFIIGLASAAVLLAIPDEGGSVYNEAERFAARAKTLRDKAIIESRPTAVRIGPGGYSLSIREEGQWKAFGRFEWASGTRAQLKARETRFDTTGMASPMRINLERGEKQVVVDIGHDGSILVRR